MSGLARPELLGKSFNTLGHNHPKLVPALQE